MIYEGLNAYDAVRNGLASGMEEVGQLYDQHRYFVPELLMAVDALCAGLDIVRPHITLEDLGDKPKGQVVNVCLLVTEKSYRNDEPQLIIDIGTNGELVLGNKDKLISSSCATWSCPGRSPIGLQHARRPGRHRAY